MNIRFLIRTALAFVLVAVLGQALAPQAAQAGLHAINYIPAANSANRLTLYFDSTAATVDSVYDVLIVSGYIGATKVRYAELDTDVILNTKGKYVYGVRSANVYGDAAVSAPSVAVLDLGAPIALSTSGAHAMHKLDSARTDTLTTGITGPDVPRSITVTGNASGINGHVYIWAPVAGVSTRLDLTCNGTATISSTVVVSGAPTKIVLPGWHASGDSVKVGYGDKIGLGVTLKRPSVLFSVEGTTAHAASALTTAIDATSVAANYVTFSSASDGTRRWFYYIAE